MAREIGYPLSVSRALANIGRVYLQQSQPEKALVVLQQAITIQRATGNCSNEADTLSLIGQAQTQLGNTDAQTNLQQSIALAHEIGNTAIEAQALRNLGLLFVKQNQPDLAIVLYKQSVKLTEDIRKGIRTLPIDQQQSYTETVADTYRQLADLLLKRDRVLEAQQVLDLLKVQELKDYLRTVRGTLQPLAVLKPEAEILKKYDQLQAAAVQLGEELAKLRAIPPDQLTPAQRQRLTQLDSLETDLNRQFRDFLSKDKQVQSWLAELRTIAPGETIADASFTNIRGKLQPLKAALLYPLVLDDRLELVITTPIPRPCGGWSRLSEKTSTGRLPPFGPLCSTVRMISKPTLRNSTSG